ncbi:MAG: PorV/PorQ family protein [Bacteroidota bacterium]
MSTRQPSWLFWAGTLLLLLAPTVFAQSTGAFARFGFGARGLSMGGALVADASGMASPYYNPALAPYTSRQHIDASYVFLSQDREVQFLQFATPVRPRAGVAAGIVRAAVSGIDGRDGSGNPTQTYDTEELGAFLAFGTRIGDRASIGLMFRFFRSDLFPTVDPAVSIGLSAGLSVQPTERLSLGLAVDDLLAGYTWDSSTAFGNDGRKRTDDFPIRLRLGASYAIPGARARVSAEVESLFESVVAGTSSVDLITGSPRTSETTSDFRLQSTIFRLGGEWQLAEPFAVRGGIDGAGTGAVLPSAGFAVNQQLGELGTMFEYAFRLEPYSAGSQHVISVRLDL